MFGLVGQKKVGALNVVFAAVYRGSIISHILLFLSLQYH